MIAKDVQIYLNDADQQVFELTANSWITKLAGLDTRLNGQYIIADIIQQIYNQVGRNNDDRPM